VVKTQFAVLGNHDYRGNVSAQLSHVLTQKDWRWFCRRSFVLCSGSILILFLLGSWIWHKWFINYNRFILKVWIFNVLLHNKSKIDIYFLFWSKVDIYFSYYKLVISVWWYRNGGVFLRGHKSICRKIFHRSRRSHLRLEQRVTQG